MKGIEPKQLEPIFYSEISSSRLLGTILKEYPEIGKSFIGNFCGYTDISNLYVENEFPYNKVGAIDIYLGFSTSDKEHIIIIEVKVHDFLSVTQGQLKTYYNAAIKESPNAIIDVIYLTQFNRNNLPKKPAIILPPSIKEYENFISNKVQDWNHFHHLNWTEIYTYINSHITILSPTHKVILELQQKWMLYDITKTIQEKTVDQKNRSIKHYFGVDIDLNIKLPFGNPVDKKNRTSYLIQMKELKEKDLDTILTVIETLINAKTVCRSYKPTNEWSGSYTGKNPAKDLLIKLSEKPENLLLLSFYSKLFSIILSKKYVELNGTGKRGFSLKVKTDNGIISLCTLWTINHTIEFSLLR